MIINCVWEHNGNDTLLYATDYIGAYTRGESLEIAKAKMPQEIVAYLKWLGGDTSDNIEIVIVGEKDSDLAIKDADSNVLFESEKAPLTTDGYEKLKALAKEKELSEVYLEPKKLEYHAKKQSPATPRQLQRLKEYRENHKICDEINWETLTKSEASRIMDKYILVYGR